VVVQIYRFPNGKTEYEFEFFGRPHRLTMEDLRPATLALYRQFDDAVTPLNCAHAVGPLLEAMSKAGWTIEPPSLSRSDIARTTTRSASGRI
jgi:hypothetical protein